MYTDTHTEKPYHTSYVPPSNKNGTKLGQRREIATKYTPRNGTQKRKHRRKSWKKMSIIYLIFSSLVLVFSSRFTLITIYIDLRLVWHWFSSEEKENSYNFILLGFFLYQIKDAQRFSSFVVFSFLLTKTFSSIRKYFSVRMLFVFVECHIILFWHYFFFQLFGSLPLFEGLALTHLSSSSFNKKTLFPLLSIETETTLRKKTQTWSGTYVEHIPEENQNENKRNKKKSGNTTEKQLTLAHTFRC